MKITHQCVPRFRPFRRGGCGTTRLLAPVQSYTNKNTRRIKLEFTRHEGSGPNSVLQVHVEFDSSATHLGHVRRIAHNDVVEFHLAVLWPIFRRAGLVVQGTVRLRGDLSSGRGWCECRRSGRVPQKAPVPHLAQRGYPVNC